MEGEESMEGEETMEGEELMEVIRPFTSRALREVDKGPVVCWKSAMD